MPIKETRSTTITNNTIHSLTYPTGGTAPATDNDVQALAASVDGCLPMAAATEPTPREGLIWLLQDGYSYDQASLYDSSRAKWVPMTRPYSEIYAGTPNAKSINSGAQGVNYISPLDATTSVGSVPIFPFDTLVRVSYSATLTQAVASDVGELQLRLGGSTVVASKGTGAVYTVSGSTEFAVAANTRIPTVQLVLVKNSGTGALSVTGDAAHNYLTATATAAVIGPHAL